MTHTPSAIISDCGLYRYRLSRSWDNGPHLTFVMLNPSTADSFQDDPTIRRCIGFAKREAFCGLHVLNLFAFRATKPDDMLHAEDPEGPQNRAYLNQAIEMSAFSQHPLICAWGSHWMAKKAGPDFVNRIVAGGGFAACLGQTKSGAPRHPLYVKSDAPLRHLASEATA